jgi:tetratricopeptide (TPR) repeat protein
MARKRTGRPSSRSTSLTTSSPPGSPARPQGVSGILGGFGWAAIIVCSGVAVYWNSLTAPFLFDDELSIVNNPQIRQLADLVRVLSPPVSTPVAGRPLVNLSFAVNYALGGLDVRGYHLFNLGVHLLAALVLFGIVRRTLDLPAVQAELGRRSVGLAAACALIWSLHPLQTEVVDYVTERSESMMGLLYLLTLYSSIRATTGHRATRWGIAAVLFCACGMACKESMVTAPFMVALYDRVFLFDSVRDSVRARWRLYAGLAATWLVLAWLMRLGPRSDSVGVSLGTSPWTYLLNQIPMIARYLRLTVWPRFLVFDYGLPQPLALHDVLPGGVFIVCLMLASAALLAIRPRLGFLTAWFFITLAPTSSVVPIVTEVGAERRMYLPLAGLVVLGVIAACSLATNIATRGWLPGLPPDLHRRLPGVPCPLRTGGILALTCLCGILAAGTVLRNREYASRLSIARTLVERRPHGRAHFDLATELLTSGDHEGGMAELWESARDYPGARFALGTELIDSGQLDAGIEQLQEFLHHLPRHANAIAARELMGRALMAEGKFDDATTQFNLLLQLAPWYADAYGSLGDIALAQRRLPEAIAQYQKMLKVRPASSRAQGNLGLALAEAGRLDEAIVAFRRTIDIDPRQSEARTNLTRALLEKGELGEATETARQALELNPNDPVAHHLLGMALASQHHLDEAIDQLRLALSGNPNDRETQQHLALALRQKTRGG